MTAGLRQGYVAGPDDQRLRVLERPIDLGGDGDMSLRSRATRPKYPRKRARSTCRYIGTFAALTFVLLVSTTLPGHVRPCPAEAHFPEPGGDPLRQEPSALRAVSRLRSRRSRARPTNCSRPTAKSSSVPALMSAILRMRSKTPLSVIVNEAGGATPTIRLPGKVTEQADDHARSGDAPSRACAYCRAPRYRRHRQTEVAPVIDALCRTMEKIHRGAGIAIDRARRPASMNFAASSRTWRRWSAISSTMPANGRARAFRDRSGCRGRARRPADDAHRRRR